MLWAHGDQSLFIVLIIESLILCCLFAHSVDLWSFGVILYQLLMNEVPFKETKNMSLVQVIMETEINWEDIPVNEEAIALLQVLLEQDPKNRHWDVLKTNKWLQ